MKNLGILLLSVILFISCEKDNGVVPEDVKNSVSQDLKGKVFSAYEAQQFTESQGNKVVDPENAFFTKMEIIGNVIELTSASNNKTRYGFEINNINRGDSELPDVLTLAMKSNYNNFYIYLNKDYSNVLITVSEGNSKYAISLK